MRRRTMKYVCFGYYDKGKFEGMTESERNTVLDEALAWGRKAVVAFRAPVEVRPFLRSNIK
jgi:hypothetical protein